MYDLREQNPISPTSAFNPGALSLEPEYDFGSNADRAFSLGTGLLEEPELGTSALLGPAPTLLAAADLDTDASVATDAQATTVDPFTERMNTELDPILTRLEGAENAQQRQAASGEVATWARANMVDQTELQAYLARTDITWEEKTATIGQLSVEIARSEFLAGWSNEGGVNAGGRNGWENDGGNLGTFPSYYQDQVRTYGRSSGAEWCTSFAGHTYGRLGFQYNQDVSQDNARSIFWSGYRLNHWAQTGQTNTGTQLTPDARTVDRGEEGNAFVDNWETLRTGLQAAKTPEAKQVATTDFITRNGAPQAGDIMVLGNNNDYRGNSKSHTVMVERYDAENQVIYTIEGNAGHAVSTRRIDLRNPTDAALIVSNVRIGASNLVDEETRQNIADGIAPEVDATRGPVTAEQLLGRARGVNSRLVGAAAREGYIESDDANASAYVWQHGSTDATDQQISVQ